MRFNKYTAQKTYNSEAYKSIQRLADELASAGIGHINAVDIDEYDGMGGYRLKVLFDKAFITTATYADLAKVRNQIQSFIEGNNINVRVTHAALPARVSFFNSQRGEFESPDPEPTGFVTLHVTEKGE
jgi:hypothetical protein